MPWPGFFHKMALADKYVFLDDVQYRDRYFHNRNQLVNSRGELFWLNVPLKKGTRDLKINQKEIVETDWKVDYLRKIQDAHSDCKFYNEYYYELELLFSNRYLKLIDLNIRIIEWLRGHLKIQTPYFFSSQLSCQNKKSDLILEICKKFSADTYLSGTFGRDYLKIDEFKKAGIDVIFHNFTSPVYESKFFMPNLSALDILMNHGPEALNIIFNKQKNI
jgi:hypothetical protein